MASEPLPYPPLTLRPTSSLNRLALHLRHKSRCQGAAATQQQAFLAEVRGDHVSLQGICFLPPPLFTGLFKMEGWPIQIQNPYREATTKGTPCATQGKDFWITFEHPSFEAMGLDVPPQEPPRLEPRAARPGCRDPACSRSCR